VKSRSVWAIIASLTVCAAPTAGHHSFAPHYDPDDVVTVTGTVAEFQFRNPHSFVLIEVANAAGGTDVWTCETNSAGVLRRQGLSPEMLTPGENVSITGAAARRDSTGCRVYTVVKADGSRLQLFGGEPSSEAEVVSGPVNEGMFGTWQVTPGSGTLGADRLANQHTGPNVFEGQLTAAGRAATDQYDQITDDPALTCTPASPWRVWDDPGSLVRIERLNDRIMLQHEVMDAVREIRLDQDAHPADVAPAPLGRSIGQLDSNVLTVETTAFSTGVFIPHPGIVMSANARLTEQIRFDSDTRQLHVNWQLDDPEFYSSPLVGEFTFEGSDLELQRYDCVPD